ncbi:CRISPR-associated endodeoxyribonuclease Cas12f1 [Syntrophomonas palmitatica]|uniref:CRISPR-associated endodeoxyribonuclease Cas12f1 n=1 Tax=Syntrophomonas palmitatica (strain DSM 18709 / JCM 14374 / NBRC 102128 / MPA) TaxID=1294023 RepID=CS12F_SYNPJ|nr:RNA-guided endonuclease TnpB family protein [Syntrophomonas palmitatica]P0DW62.1 RecName: Full=CRISPR-associated endodeoxyribonuclease Cas12f1; Short=SpCas12f1; AltName: Full=CRISPR-associated endonuclease C2c10 [Syntrophomonas palmitatica JCM 14374]
MGESVKAIKLKILDMFLDPECTKQDDNWRKDLSTMSRFCAEAGNMCLRDLYNYFSMPKEDRISSKDLYNAMYHKTKLLHPELPGKVANQIVNHAKDVWKRNAKLIYRNQISMPTYKITTAPIRLQNNIYKLIKNKNKYIIDVQLYSKEYSKDSGKGTHRYFLVAVRDSSTRMIFDRIMSKDHIDSSKSYTQGQLQIKKDHQGKWYCIIPYTFPTHETVLDPDKVMGVDLGVAKAVYWAFNSSYKRGCIDGGEIEHFRKMIRARRVSIQNQIKHSGDARKGHGRKRALKPIETLSEKEKNFRDTINHRYANRIVEAAIKQGCGTIQIENLEGIADTTGSKFLKNWPYYDLQTKIVNKAKEHGITVVAINPQYTSQRCSMCGYIEKTNRSSQAVFECKQCGYGSRTICINCRHVQVSGDVCEECGGIVKKENVNADYNAAKNISTPYIDQIIMEKCLELGIPYRSITCKECGHIQASGNTCEVCGSTNILKPKKIRKAK